MLPPDFPKILLDGRNRLVCVGHVHVFRSLDGNMALPSRFQAIWKRRPRFIISCARLAALLLCCHDIMFDHHMNAVLYAICVEVLCSGGGEAFKD